MVALYFLPDKNRPRHCSKNAGGPYLRSWQLADARSGQLLTPVYVFRQSTVNKTRLRERMARGSHGSPDHSGLIRHASKVRSDLIALSSEQVQYTL